MELNETLDVTEHDLDKVVKVFRVCDEDGFGYYDQDWFGYLIFRRVNEDVFQYVVNESEEVEELEETA